MKAAIEDLAVIGPGLPDWARARELLRGEQAYVHAPVDRLAVPLLPKNEQRRLTGTSRLALALAHAVTDTLTGEERASLSSVFASSVGDCEIADRICMALTLAGRPVSPTQFHNSVHNAPAGYWAIATGNRSASTSVAAGAYSAAAGLLDAVTRTVDSDGRVLFVAYDHAPPPRLAPSLGIEAPFGVAMLLSSRGYSCNALYSLSVRTTSEPGQWLDDPWGPLQRSNPIARSLGLLAALARGERRAVLELGPSVSLDIGIDHGC